jgi:REP element-mobilizing transposase RayT
LKGRRRNKVIAPYGCSTLLTDQIEALREAARRTRERYPFHINAFVVLPDHLHAIRTLPEDDPDFSRRWRLIKIQFSKSIPSRRAVNGHLAAPLLGTPDQGRRGLSPPRGILLH